MSEPKHTPGPWRYSPATGTDGHGFAAQVWGPDGTALATIDTINAEATPNARLVAAAPDLYAAAKLLIEVDADPDPARRAAAWEALMDAVDKAEGK